MFGGGMFGGGQQQGGQGGQQQQQQGGGGMFGGMMGGMMGGGQQQQPQHQQQHHQQQHQGGGGGMFGGMLGGMMGGGSGGGDAFSHLFTDRNENAPAPEVVPAAATQFKAKAQCLFPMFPMVCDTVLYYDFLNMRQRIEWPGMGGLAWEVERWDIKYKVKLGGPQEQPEVNELPQDQSQSSYGIVPCATYEGTEKVRGIECHRFYFDFFGMAQCTTWTSIPQSKDDVCVPIFNKSIMMGMKISMHFSEHDLDFDFSTAGYLFDIESYVPPKGVPTEVSGYVKDATNNRPIPGARVQFAPSSGQAASDTMSGTCNEHGRFSVTLPVAPGGCEYDVSYAAQGFCGLTKPQFNVVGPIPAGTFADACLSPMLQKPQMRAVLRWGANPRDLDIYCTKEDGTPVASYQRKVGPQAQLNIDVQTSYGPETITMSDCENTEEPLLIQVHHYAGAGAMPGCGAVVDFYDHTGHCFKATVPPGGFERWWKVARISAGNVEVINTLQ